MRIILIEDNQNDAELTIRALKKNKLSTDIILFHDGEKAIEYLLDEKLHGFPGIILLDIKLPKFNGIEVLKVLKENKKTKMIPVIMLTSSCEVSDIASCYDLGVNGFVVKPLDYKDFLNMISEIAVYWLKYNKTLAEL
jgi:two-component system, response regulator